MGTAAMFPEKETRIIEKKTCKTIMILRVFSDIDAVVPNQRKLLDSLFS